MVAYVALLRAVNLPNSGSVRKDALRDFLARAGLEDPRTLLQSGNAVFRSRVSNAEQLERQLEREAARELGLVTDFFVRSADAWREIVARNPFSAEAERDPAHLVVTVLKDAPDSAHWAKLAAGYHGPETVRGDGRQAYIVYPLGIGRSRLTAAVIERHLGTRGTSRNWNTVLKLAELLEA